MANNIVFMVVGFFVISMFLIYIGGRLIIDGENFLFKSADKKFDELVGKYNDFDKKRERDWLNQIEIDKERWFKQQNHGLGGLGSEGQRKLL